MITLQDKEISGADKKQALINEMRKRILSALGIGIVFISSILLSIPPFTALMMIIGIVMAFEWYQMTRGNKAFLFLGPVIIFPSIISLILIHDENNKWIIFSYFAMIWAVDTFAMIGGRKIGGPKLIPSLSPNKTWSGLIIGVVSGNLVFLGMYQLLAKKSLDQDLIFAKHILVFSIIITLMAQVSDLFISYFKRKFSVKDSGKIIPGHGGMLDRFDSIILTAPILFFTLYSAN